VKRTFVYDPTTKKMVEVNRGRSDFSATTVWGDLKPFVSSANGEYITDRGQLRRHMKLHGIAFADEMKGTAERVRQERAKRERHERITAVQNAYEHVRNLERSKKRFG
jgi:hypothetical protein